MKIEHKASADVQAEVARVRDQSAAPASRAPERAGSSGRAALVRDRIELSAEARALSRASSLSPSRLQTIRQQILVGAYDTAEVLDAVARNILRSGDL